jgi:phage-related protein
MALTTQMTSIETRTDSITKVVDFTAKFLRRGLKNFIGRFNITQGFLDSLGHVIQGLLTFLSDAGVLIGASMNNIVQDEDAPDTVLVDITLDVPFPCNYIRLTLVI